MADFTCPKCNFRNVVDPPGGESWWDGNTEEFDCQQCDASLYVYVRVEIELVATLNDDTPVDAEDDALPEVAGG